MGKHASSGSKIRAISKNAITRMEESSGKRDAVHALSARLAGTKGSECRQGRQSLVDPTRQTTFALKSASLFRLGRLPKTCQFLNQDQVVSL